MGTGVLVSDRHVLTAAHVVHPAYKNMHQHTITVIPALDDLDEPFGSYSISSKPKIRKEFSPTAADHLDWDYALLTLRKAIGTKSFSALKGGTLCYWGSPQCGSNTVFARLDPRTLNGKAAYTAGYPGGKGGKQLWCAAGILHSAHERRRTMWITADTTGGQSGSPVWVIDNKRYCLVGVATAGGANANRVVRVTRELIRQVRAWISEDGDTPSMTEAKELFEPAEIELGEAEESLPEREEDDLSAARRSRFRIPEEVEFFGEPEEGHDDEEVGFSEFPESPYQEYDVSPTVSKAISDALDDKDWARALELAIQEGWRDENDLTNLLFFKRHPELGERKLDPTKNKEDKKLSQEWGRILNGEVWPAIQKASERADLKVSGHYVAERDPDFWGKSGKEFKDLVKGVADEVEINPGLLSAVLLAETRRSNYLGGEVSSFVTGTDDFFAQRAQLRANVPAFSKVRFDETKISRRINEHEREVISIPFKSGKDAVWATAVYLKYGEIKLRKAAEKNGGDFDKLPIETRFALVRIAMTAGHGGITPDGEFIRFKKKLSKKRSKPVWVRVKPGEKGGVLIGVAERLDRVLKGEDILVRQDEPRKDPTNDPHITNRNATILVAQAMHLSDWIFGIPLAAGVQPELEGFEDIEDHYERSHHLNSDLEEYAADDEVEDVELEDEVVFTDAEEYEDESDLFEALAPKVASGDLRARIDEYFDKVNVEYDLEDGTKVKARPQFLYAKAGGTEEAIVKVKRIPGSQFEKEHPRAIRYAAYGRAKPSEVAAITQGLIDAGELNAVRRANPGLTDEQLVRKLQREFKMGIDCAGYVQLAFIYAFMGNDDDTKKVRLSLGLNERRGYEKLASLPSSHFKKVAVTDAQTGDLFVLKPRADSDDRAWHTVIVVDHTVSRTVHTFLVDASWGTDLYGEAAGGVARRELKHDTSTGKWWDIHPLDGSNAHENSIGPYNEHPIYGMYRAKQKK